MVTSHELAFRRGLLLIVMASAVTAVLAGLARLGIVTDWGATRAPEHGALLVVGVFGTVIGLERAVALGLRWSYAAPVLGAAGAAGMLGGMPWAFWPSTASCVALVAVNIAIVRRQPAACTWLMLLGSAVYLAGSLVWALGRPVFEVVPAWIAFLVLTIVAERLELSRLAPTPRWAQRAVTSLAVLLALAALVSLAGMPQGLRTLGVALFLLGGWQLRFDVATRTLRRQGLPRFVAAGVLLGSAWLSVGGLLLAIHGLPAAGPLYDAILHAVLVGFVLSMVFAHAPIILPAVARIGVPFHPVLYLPLAVLHAGLAVRVIGDLAASASGRQLGALGNSAAIALFLVAVLWARVRSQRGLLRFLASRRRCGDHA